MHTIRILGVPAMKNTTNQWIEGKEPKSWSSAPVKSPNTVQVKAPAMGISNQGIQCVHLIRYYC